MKSPVVNATLKWRANMNIEELRKPILSYRMPLKDGPINAPRANVLVHKPEIRPNVSRLLGKP